MFVEDAAGNEPENVVALYLNWIFWVSGGHLWIWGVSAESPSRLGPENCLPEDTGSSHQGPGVVGGTSTQLPGPMGLYV